MATSILNFTPVHGVAESSDLLATIGGAHILNGVAEVDLDNGSFAKVGDFAGIEDTEKRDVWKIEKPTEQDTPYLVLNVPQIYEDWLPQMQEERNYYIAAGELIRLYQLKPRDKFALSKECFANPDEVAVGKYLKIDDFKATAVDEKPTGASVMKIYDTASNGLFRVVVEEIIQ